MDQTDSVEEEGSISLAQAPKPNLGPGRDYIEETAKRESQGQRDNGYGASKPQLGRYQMTNNALIDAGMKDLKGNWTGKYNVNSESEFLSNHAAQDLAFSDYTKKTASYLHKNNSMQSIGQPIDGKVGKFAITEAGLVAAAHRQGHGYVQRYLSWQKANNWKSDFSTLPQKDVGPFELIENRLREFEKVPYR